MTRLALFSLLFCSSAHAIEGSIHPYPGITMETASIASHPLRTLKLRGKRARVNLDGFYFSGSLALQKLKPVVTRPGLRLSCTAPNSIPAEYYIEQTGRRATIHDFFGFDFHGKAKRKSIKAKRRGNGLRERLAIKQSPGLFHVRLTIRQKVVPGGACVYKYQGQFLLQ